jgi:cobalt/nickel transport system permease protein
VQAVQNRIPSYLLRNVDHPYEEFQKGRRTRSVFLERGLLGLSRVIKNTYMQWDLSGRDGLFQRLDPRLKLLFLVFFAVAVSLKKDIGSELVVASMLLGLNLLSRLQLIPLYSRILVLSFVFGVLLSFPSACNIVVPGTVVVPLIDLDTSYDFLFYHIPKTIGLTDEGLALVALLSLRVMNSVTICLLVLFTTPFPQFIKAFRLLHVPDVLVMVLTLFYKYLFILASTLEEMHQAMKSRLISNVPGNDARKWVVGRMAHIYRRSHQNCEEVFRAMLSRGFTGEMRLTEPHPLRRVDWIAGSVLFVVWVAILLL